MPHKRLYVQLLRLLHDKDRDIAVSPIHRRKLTHNHLGLTLTLFRAFESFVHAADVAILDY